MDDVKSSLKARKNPPRTARELADYLNVSYKTAWGWWSGKSLPKDKFIRSRLLTLVGSASSNDDIEVLPLKSAESRKVAKQMPERSISRQDLIRQLTEVRSLAAELNARLTLVEEEVRTSKVDGCKLDNLLERFVAQLYDMSETLTIVAADNDRRQAFRNRVSKEDVAYLTTLLEALLDEQKFTLWQVFQNFPMKEVRNK